MDFLFVYLIGMGGGFALGWASLKGLSVRWPVLLR